MEQVDCIVVGAGVIGLAIARTLARSGRDVLLIEANERFGAETSSRNNEVIHAGFLYPADSLKARLCRTGRDQLYRYCQERGVAHRRIGKLMIATSASELSVLRSLADTAKSHGVEDLVWLESEAVREREPNLACLAALHSPSTGIVDAHGLMLALLGDAESAGATIVYRTRVTGGAAAPDGVVIQTLGNDGATTTVHCRTLVNAAGLGARDLAMCLRGGLDDIPAIDLAKGNFFSYAGPLPFQRLIVPLGDTLAAGAAFTIDGGGQGKFGPDLEWATQVDYSVNPDRAKAFVAGIQRFFPAVDASRLAPNFSGIRPRVRNANGAPSDWLILGPSEHGLQSVFHLLGFDTPGLTTCLAVADYVAAALNNAGEHACRTTASSE
jgi:L-2-hydroxyglutarate oxidase LhgO